MRNQGLKCSSLPKADMGFELGPSAECGDKDVDSGKFRDVVAGSSKEFVVANSVATEIAELVELREGCSDRSVIKSRGDRERTPKRCLELMFSNVI